MEEYFHLMHQLLTHPRPLLSAAENYPPLPRLRVISVYKTPFETALSAATLLCLRAPTLELISGNQANNNLLALLFAQLDTILVMLRQGRCQGVVVTEDFKSADEFIASARPFLIWMCLLWDVIAVYTNFDQGTLLNRGYSVVRQLLVEILGGDRGTENITEEDLGVTREWHIGYIINGKWDERKTLKRMLEGGLSTMPP